MHIAQIKAIAEVGSIVAAAIYGDESPESILAPLRAIAPFDAAMIAVRDPLTGRHQPLLSQGYAAPVLGFLSCDYLSCKSYDQAARTNRPMRMQDYGSWFFHTRMYQEHLDGAGYREGITLILRSRRRRLTGLLTMSFEDSRAADDDARAALELVGPSLGQLVDVRPASDWLASVMGGDAASFLVDESGAAVPTSDTAGSDRVSRAVQAVNRAFLAAGRDSARGYCFDSKEGRWHRIHLVRLPAQQRGEPLRALLMIRSEPLPHHLTERELDVLTLVARGLSNRDVAARLRTSPRTVGTHVEHLLTKTGRTNRTGLAAIAAELGLVRLELHQGPEQL